MADKKTVFAIDDLPMDLAVFENILCPYYDLKISTSAPEALSLLDDIKPDLIILDIEMPSMSGFEFLHEIRKLPQTMSTPVIVVTAHDDEKFAVHAESQGANKTLTKPVNPSYLLSQVSDLLDKKPPKSKLEELFSKMPSINLD
ncbi:MAG: response regulator [Treponema sp.]|jgi:CheY-like chemotaxis protein|nr:response regulator [Treponema sp.]